MSISTIKRGTGKKSRNVDHTPFLPCYFNIRRLSKLQIYFNIRVMVGLFTVYITKS